ncbi:MAG: FAD-binding domain-containing protein [Bacteroidia bacterium]
MFLTDLEAVLRQVDAIDPVAYARTRNHLDGAVTRLSPYISRGILTTRQVMKSILDKGRPFHEVEKLIQELAWRDHWQMVWRNKGDGIFEDIRQPQSTAKWNGVPSALLNRSTGIQAIDDGIRELEETGYMHNHLRMYTAMLTCHVARYHWNKGALDVLLLARWGLG